MIVEFPHRGPFALTDCGFINTCQGRFWHKDDIEKAWKKGEVELVLPPDKTIEDYTYLLVIDKISKDVIMTVNKINLNPRNQI
jgi:hypothetical protein